MKLTLCFLGIITVCQINAQRVNITDFGATTDSTILNTKFIQSAIDHCFKKGGGEVVVPAGIFYTGTIFLKSNVYLHLAPGAVLQGSYRPEDYPEYNILAAKKFGTITHDGIYVKYMKALVIADNAQYTGILGTGTLKGAGEGKAFQLGLNKDGKPKNIFFISCKNVLLKDVTILNAAQITVSISGCEKVNIDGIYLNSIVNWNGDGLDIDAKEVTISNCFIDSEDDALCFKSEYLDKFCENITVTNCVVSSLCNGIKLGTGSRTGFRNISVTNCVIKKSPVNGYRHWVMPPEIVYEPEVQSVNTGIVILGVDGGVVENIHFSDIIMNDVLSPFFIRVGSRFLNPDNKPSVMRNISLGNITAHTRSILPSIIAGLANSPVTDIRLSNIRISNPIVVSPAFFNTFPTTVTENVKGYPENRLTFGVKVPAAAFYIKQVQGIVMSDLFVTYGVGEARPAFLLEETTNARFSNVFVNGDRLERLENNVKLKNSRLLDDGIK